MGGVPSCVAGKIGCLGPPLDGGPREKPLAPLESRAPPLPRGLWMPWGWA